MQGEEIANNQYGKTTNNKINGEEAVAEETDTSQTVIKTITKTVMEHNKETVILWETIKGVKIGIITG